MAVQLYARVVDGIVVELWPHDPAAALPEGVSTPVDAFGEAFGSQFVACGADVPQGWTYDGKSFAAPVVVVPPVPVRTATTYQLMSALTDAQRTTYANAKPWDQRLFSARDTPWPETNEKIGRIATALGTTPAAWFDAALGASA